VIPLARCASVPRLLQAEETTCSKQRRAEHAHLNHAPMEMCKYSAVPEAMGALHAGSGLITLHTETVLPGEGLTKLCLFISSGPAVLSAVQTGHLVPFPISGINGEPYTDFVGLELSSKRFSC